MSAPTSNRPIGLAPGAPEQAAGQDEKKYHTTNPVVQKLLARWSGQLREVVGPIAADATIVDIGVGEGLCLERIIDTGRAAIGLEYRFDKVLAGRARLTGLAGIVGDAGMVPLTTGCADLVTCIEVLEHLVTDEPAVAELARLTADNGKCVVSVPWEPWFRLGNLGRGKNVKRFGNDPEHVQFFTPKRLKAMLELSFTDVRVVPTFPWLIAEAKTPKR